MNRNYDSLGIGTCSSLVPGAGVHEVEGALVVGLGEGVRVGELVA